MIRTAHLISALVIIISTTVFAQNSAVSGWWRGADMPTARSEITATHVGGQIYIAGGIQFWGGTQKAFESYDIAADEWIKRADLPHRIHHVALASHDGIVYASGGYTNLRFKPNAPELWAYDPATNNWQARADMPAPRGEHVMIEHEGLIYVIGGRGPGAQALWMYDPATDTWHTNRAPMPTYRHSVAAVLLDQSIYVMGGRLDDSSAIDVVERYDIPTDTWHPLPPLPEPRAGHGAAVIDGKIHIFGGEYLDTAQVLNLHTIYDPATNKYSSGTAMPQARHGVAVIDVDNRAYVIGGGTSSGWRTIYSASDRIDIFGPAHP